MGAAAIIAAVGVVVRYDSAVGFSVIRDIAGTTVLLLLAALGVCTLVPVVLIAAGAYVRVGWVVVALPFVVGPSVRVSCARHL